MVRAWRLLAFTAMGVVALSVPSAALAAPSVTLAPAQSPSPYSARVLADSPLLYYRLGDANGSGTVIDSSGNGHGGAANGGVTLGQMGALPGDPDTSASFDGSTGVVNSGTQVLSPSSTIEAWIRPTRSQGCFGSGCSDGQEAIAGTGGSFQLTFGRVPSTVRVWLWPLDNSGWQALDAATTVPLNQWTYVAATWDATTQQLSIYINGALSASRSLPGVSSSRQPGTSFNFTVGGFSPGEQSYQGGIDEVAYYGSALSPGQILAHYRAAATLVIPTSGTVTTLFLDPANPGFKGAYYDQNNVLEQETIPSHPGVDIQGATTACSSSAPVYAAGNGTVKFAGWIPGFGWSVVIDHGQFPVANVYPTYYLFTLYGHMGTSGKDPAPKGTSVSCISPALTVGQQVFAGTTLLGYQGNSGEVKGVTGVHLHWQLYVNTTGDEWTGKKGALPLASPDFETCLRLTNGDSSLPPVTTVMLGQNAC